MQVTNLPTSLGQWRRYFEQTFSIIEDVVEVAAFGQNKIELILMNLQKFRNIFLENHPPSVPSKEGRILFEFFKTCAAFISILSQYKDDNFISYFCQNNINYQFEELSKLWCSWSVMSSMLLIDTFQDLTPLCYANFLDLRIIYDSLKPSLEKLPIPVANALRRKLEDVLLILGQIPNASDDPTPGIIDHSQFETGESIGVGAYASVKLGKLKSNGKEIAVKELKSVQLSKRNIITLKRELNSLLRLKHPNILEFVGVTVTPPFCIVTKYINGGNLFDLLHNPNRKLNAFEKQKIALCLARGLEYLSVMRFLHRDFKSQNILLDENLNPVICDFGISRQLGPNMTTELGTAQWAAPEVIASNRTNYDLSIDTYSLGVVLWEIETGKVPFYGYRTVQIAALILNGQRPEFTDPVLPEMKHLIEHCWAQEPRHRPKISQIRKILETMKATFTGFDKKSKKQFLDFVKKTKREHHKIMKVARQLAASEDATILEKLHVLNPLDSSALKILQQVYQMDYQISIKLFEDILRLTNQTISIPVQDAAFEILKQMLSRDNIATIIDPQKIIDELTIMLETQPLFVITAVKLVADKVNKIEDIIEKFLNMTTSHVTLEIIQAIITYNKDKANPQLLIHIFNSLKGQFATAFFRFILSIYGPLNEFLPVSCKSLVYISLFMKELAGLCESDVEKVKEMLQVPDINDEGRSVLQQYLDSISLLISNPDLEINEKMGLIIIDFIVDNCFKFNSYTPILPLLCLCARIDDLKKIISASDIWDLVIDGLEINNINHKSALELLETIPMTDSDEIKEKVWDRILSIYSKTHDKKVAHAIASLLEKSENYDLTKLIPQILEGLNSEDENFCLSVLKIGRPLSNEGFKSLIHGHLFSLFTRQLSDKSYKICKLIGKVAAAMIDKMDDFPFDPEFFTSVLVFLYDNETPFLAAMPFIIFLIHACKYKNILVFLQRRYFVKYIEQLPWRYDQEAKVGDAIEYCVTTLTHLYPTKEKFDNDE